MSLLIVFAASEDTIAAPGTPVSDLSPLRELKNLSSIDLRRTRVTDLSPLRKLKSLSTLTVDYKVIDRKTVEFLKRRGVKVAGTN